MSDNVNHPKHYNSGRIEVIEAIEDWKLNYHRGQVVKYVARAGKKDPTKEIEDLEKAAWYVKREVEMLKASKDGREPLRPNDMAEITKNLVVTDSRICASESLGSYTLKGTWQEVESEDEGDEFVFVPEVIPPSLKIFAGKEMMIRIEANYAK